MIAPPPGRAGPDRDLERRVAELEALIEEARRRARRRRRLYAAAVLAAGAAVAAALGGFGGGSGRSSVGSRAAESASTAAAAQPGAGRWVPTGGPDGGGGPIAVDPTNSRILYAGGTGTVFKSTDAGASWRAVTAEPWKGIDAIAIDPSQPQVVYAASERGIAKTVDGGRHWRMVDNGLFTGETQRQRGLRLSEGFVSSLVVDRQDPQTVYAITWTSLLRTRDGGAHWHVIGPARFRAPTCSGCRGFRPYQLEVAIAPQSSTIYASWQRRQYNGTAPANLYVSADRGDTWQLVPRGAGRPSWFDGLVIDRAGTLYATEAQLPGFKELPGVVESRDGGRTWTSAGLSTLTVWQVQVDAGNGSTLYAGTPTGSLESSDGGTTWRSVATGADAPTGAIVTDPNDPNVLYGNGDTIVKSSDGGRTWAAADNGLVATWISSLALAPGSGSTLYAGADSKVFKSVDGGRTWQVERSGLGAQAWVAAVLVDPKDGHTLYAVQNGQGLFKSSDAGVHWSHVRTPFPSNGIRALAIDPQDQRTLYVSDCGGACARGVFEKTTDGGASWQPITGISFVVQSVAIDSQHPNVVFAGTARGDIFRSSDGARTWRRVVTPPTLPLSHQYAIDSIVIDPRNSENVYAGRKGGVIKSADGGLTWHRASNGMLGSDADALAIDPADPRVLYASNGQASTSRPARVFRSTDGARTWHPLGAGLPAVGVDALAVDASGRSVFAGTAGDGVVRLRTDG